MAIKYVGSGGSLIVSGGMTVALGLMFAQATPFAAIPLGVAGVGALLIAGGLKRKLGAAAFSTARIQLQGGAPMGGTASVRILLSPKKPVEITAATLTFFTEEKAVYQSGKNRRIDRHEVHRWSTPVAVPRRLAETFHHSVQVPVPRDLPPTFKGAHNSLRSYARLDLGIAKRPDLQLQEEIEILPEVAHG